MSLIDHAMKANEQFAKKYDPKLGGTRSQDRDRHLHGPELSNLEGILD